MRTVLIYRTLILPFSETFIKEQVTFLRSWRGVLIGRKLARQLLLDKVETQILGCSPTAIGEGINSLYWRLGIVPPLGGLRKLNPSLLHVHFGVDAIDAASIADKLNLPMVVTFHGYDITVRRDWWEGGEAGRRMQNYPNQLLALGERKNVQFIAVSDALRERAIKFGIPESKISTSYIGIDTEKFGLSDVGIARRENRVLFVGRLVAKKGCEYLIRAMKTVRESVNDAHLVVIGDGPLKEELQKVALQVGVSVEFLGVQTSSQIQEQLSRSRVFCLPSVEAPNGDLEGFGLVLLEAQAAGVPVVTSAFGGSTEGILDGETGFAVKSKDADGIAASLVKLLTNQDLLLAMSNSARKFAVEKFDIRKLTMDLETVYDRAISSHDR